jgi:hypothetical protein
VHFRRALFGHGAETTNETAPGGHVLRPLKEILEADPSAATIVAVPCASVPPLVFGPESIVVAVDLDASFGRIGESFFGAQQHSGRRAELYGSGRFGTRRIGISPTAALVVLSFLW